MGNEKRPDEWRLVRRLTQERDAAIERAEAAEGALAEAKSATAAIDSDDDELFGLDLEGTSGAWVMRGDPTKDVPAVAQFYDLPLAEEYIEWHNARVLSKRARQKEIGHAIDQWRKAHDHYKTKATGLAVSLTEERRLRELAARDHAELESAIRDALRPALGAAVDGDGCAVPGLAELVQRVVGQVARLRGVLERVDVCTYDFGATCQLSLDGEKFNGGLMGWKKDRDALIAGSVSPMNREAILAYGIVEAQDAKFTKVVEILKEGEASYRASEARASDDMEKLKWRHVAAGLRVARNKIVSMINGEKDRDAALAGEVPPEPFWKGVSYAELERAMRDVREIIDLYHNPGYDHPRGWPRDAALYVQTALESANSKRPEHPRLQRFGDLLMTAMRRLERECSTDSLQLAALIAKELGVKSHIEHEMEEVRK